VNNDNFGADKLQNTHIKTALDARKAFDRVNHVKLFNLLLDNNVPPRVVRVICDWYGKTTCVVRWRNCLSEVFVVKSGKRQGGILSPVLFNMYFDTLLCELRRNGEGCYLGRHYAGCIAYADDLILLSASLCNLQSMLDVCHNVGSILLLTLVNHIYLRWVLILLSISLGLTLAVMIFNGQIGLNT